MHMKYELRAALAFYRLQFWPASDFQTRWHESCPKYFYLIDNVNNRAKWAPQCRCDHFTFTQITLRNIPNQLFTPIYVYSSRRPSACEFHQYLCLECHALQRKYIYGRKQRRAGWNGLRRFVHLYVRHVAQKLNYFAQAVIVWSYIFAMNVFRFDQLVWAWQTANFSISFSIFFHFVFVYVRHICTLRISWIHTILILPTAAAIPHLIKWFWNISQDAENWKEVKWVITSQSSWENKMNNKNKFFAAQNRKKRLRKIK